MAHDLFFKKSNRNWARSSVATSIGNDTPPTTTKTGKVVLAGMAVATAVGLAFITSPWWLPMNKMVATARPTIAGMGNKTPARNYHTRRFPGGRIIITPV